MKKVEIVKNMLSKIENREIILKISYCRGKDRGKKN